MKLLNQWFVNAMRTSISVLLLLVVATGCANFEHPLDWEENANSDALLGSWRTIEGDGAVEAMVSRSEQGALEFDIKLVDPSDAATQRISFAAKDDARYVKFLGRLLATNDMHVLQIDMTTYRELDRHGDELDGVSNRGYQFARVTLKDDKEPTAEFQRLDVERFAHVAVDTFTESELKMPAMDFVDCIDSEITLGLFANVLVPDDDADPPPITWDDSDEYEALEIAAQKFNAKSINPYEELAELRQCIALKLPGEFVGELFEHHADEVFTGVVERVRRLD